MACMLSSSRTPILPMMCMQFTVKCWSKMCTHYRRRYFHIVCLFVASCTASNTWSNAILNTNVFGGTANSATTVAACMSVCSSSANCIGIDWNTLQSSGQQCFIIYTTTPGPRNNGTATGITHYDYVTANCSCNYSHISVAAFINNS